MVMSDRAVKSIHAMPKWARKLRRRYPWFPDQPRCYGGWAKIIGALCAGIQRTLDDDENYRKKFSAYCCKEKYGRLRFYVTPPHPDIEQLIDKADTRSATVCERCGKPGMLRKKGYMLYTACDVCAVVEENRS